MSTGELLGTIGVLLLLLAFALNITKKWASTSTAYLSLNVIGAIMTCISSYLIRFWPFVILEGVWAISSLVILIKTRMKHD